MHRDVLTHFPFLSLVVIGQLLFLTIFVGALFWVFRKGSKSFYDRMSSLPIDNGGNCDE